MEFFMVMFEILGTLGLLFVLVWIVEPRETFEGLPWPLGPREIDDSSHKGGAARGCYKPLSDEEISTRLDRGGCWRGDDLDEFWGDEEPRYFKHELLPLIEKSKGEDGEASLCLRKVRK